MRFFTLLLLLFLMSPQPARAASILPVPFTTQAPQNQWRTQPFADACEEATVIMLEAFYAQKTLNPVAVRDRIKKLAAYEQKTFGFHRDTNSTYTARLLSEQTAHTGYVVENPTIDMIKAEIDAGQPVIHIAYSPALLNPFFQRVGNPYHVLLIIGYDDETAEFITHDPGTRHGKNYRYPIERLMSANHDYQKPNRGTGRKAMVFTRLQK